MELRHDFRSPASVSSSSSSRQRFDGGSSYSHIDMLEKEAADYEKYVLSRADNISRTYERISKGFNTIRSSPRREDPPVQASLSSSISSFKSSFRSSFAPPPPLVHLGSSASAASSSPLSSPLNTSVNNAYNVRDAYKDITRTNSVEKKLRDGGFSVSRSRSPSPSPVRSARSISLRSTASSPSASPRNGSSSRFLSVRGSPSRSPSHNTFRASPLRSPRPADVHTQTYISSPQQATTTSATAATAATESNNPNFSDWYMEDLKLQMETLRRHNVDLATSLKCREEEVLALRDKYKAQQKTIEELQLTQEVNQATREGLLKPGSAYESIQAKTIENLYGDIARLEAEKIEMQLSMDDVSRRLQNKEQEYRTLQHQLNQVKSDLKQERDRYTRLLQSQQQTDFKSSHADDDAILDSYLGTTKQKLDSAFNSTTTSPVRNQPSRSSRTPSSDDTWTRALPKEPYPNVSLSALDSVTQDFIASKIDEQSRLHNKDDFSFEESAILKEAERKAREDAIFESEDPFFTSLRFHVARSAMKQSPQRSQTATTAHVDVDLESYRYSLQSDVEDISWTNGTDSYVRSQLNQSVNHTPNDRDNGSKHKEILNDIQEVVNGLRAAKTPNERDARYREGLAQLRQSFQSTPHSSSN